MYANKHKPRRLLADETLQFSRYSPTSLSVVDGLRVRQEQDVIRFTCTGNVQPLGGRDLRMLPEGEQVEGQLQMWIWHDDAELPPLPGDLVVRDGNYLVTSATDWGAYTVCRLTRDDANVIKDG